MSEVEKFYYAIAAKLGVTRKWEELHPAEQHQFVNGINMIMGVMK